MNRMVIALILSLGLAACSGMSVIRPSDVSGTPTTYCTVVKAPNPLLMGGWKCGVNRSDRTSYDFNAVAYYLVKSGDQYGLYFYRVTRGGKKRYVGWKNWVISGDEITSDTGIRIFAADGTVYFQWESQKPVPMARIEGL